MKQVFNFSAGPACIPTWVLKKAKQQMLDYHGCGMSVMEMSHRSKEYETILNTCKQRFISVMQIPDTYDVLFLQGGASLQFSMIPLNFLKTSADIIHTGEWTKKAIREHEKIGKTNIIASSANQQFTYIPKISKDDLSKDSDYLYICENNTIYGTKYKQLPIHDGKRLIADCSSCILSELPDISQYDLIFAGSQKNLGPAGVCIVIIKKQFLTSIKENIPSMLNYKTYADHNSMFNTPPTYTIYIMGLVLEWLETEIGELKNIEKINREKASLLYQFIDNSTFYSNHVVKDDRSYTNIPFITKSSHLDALFVKEAQKVGLVNLKGYRSVGGMRASLYNAMPIEGVNALIQFMKQFEIEYEDKL